MRGVGCGAGARRGFLSSAACSQAISVRVCACPVCSLTSLSRHSYTRISPSVTQGYPDTDATTHHTANQSESSFRCVLGHLQIKIDLGSGFNSRTLLDCRFCAFLSLSVVLIPRGRRGSSLCSTTRHHGGTPIQKPQLKLPDHRQQSLVSAGFCLSVACSVVFRSLSIETCKVHSPTEYRTLCLVCVFYSSPRLERMVYGNTAEQQARHETATRRSGCARAHLFYAGSADCPGTTPVCACAASRTTACAASNHRTLVTCICRGTTFCCCCCCMSCSAF